MRRGLKGVDTGGNAQEGDSKNLVGSFCEVSTAYFQGRDTTAELALVTMALIPKGKGDYQGIGLVKVS